MFLQKNDLFFVNDRVYQRHNLFEKNCINRVNSFFAINRSIKLILIDFFYSLIS